MIFDVCEKMHAELTANGETGTGYGIFFATFMYGHYGLRCHSILQFVCVVLWCSHVYFVVQPGRPLHRRRGLWPWTPEPPGTPPPQPQPPPPPQPPPAQVSKLLSLSLYFRYFLPAAISLHCTIVLDLLLYFCSQDLIRP